MTTFDLIQGIVITLIVAASANQAVRTFAPGSHKRARHWLFRKLGRNIAEPADAATGCDTGCGTCSTGCGSPAESESKTAAAKESPSEQPLTFRPRDADSPLRHH